MLYLRKPALQASSHVGLKGQPAPISLDLFGNSEGFVLWSNEILETLSSTGVLCQSRPAGLALPVLKPRPTVPNPPQEPIKPRCSTARWRSRGRSGEGDSTSDNFWTVLDWNPVPCEVTKMTFGEDLKGFRLRYRACGGTGDQCGQNGDSGKLHGRL